jgi:hypothetical protein
MAEKSWPIPLFLEKLELFPALWDKSNDDYCNNNVKMSKYCDLMVELQRCNLEGVELEAVKRKIKLIRTTYLQELNKIKKSKSSGASAEQVYKPRLTWFSAADRILGNTVRNRTSLSNLEVIIAHFPL